MRRRIRSEKLFDQSDPLLNAVLTNIATFAGDISGGLVR